MSLTITPCGWSCCVNTTMTLSPVILDPRKPLNCCRAITGSPACMHLSSPTSRHVTPVPAASRHATFNMVNSRRCPHPPVPGNRIPATSLSIYHPRMGTTLFLFSWTASRKCATSHRVSKQPTPPSLPVFSSTTSFGCTASQNPSSQTADRSLLLIFGNR